MFAYEWAGQTGGPHLFQKNERFFSGATAQLSPLTGESNCKAL